MFDPTGACPTFVISPKIARPVRQKEHVDEVQYKQLVKANVSVAPIHSGLDGGMNRVFLAQIGGNMPPADRSPQPAPVSSTDKMARSQVNCSAPFLDRSPPRRRKSPPTIPQLATAARIRRQLDRLLCRKQSLRPKLRPSPLQRRSPVRRATTTPPRTERARTTLLRANRNWPPRCSQRLRLNRRQMPSRWQATTTH